MKNLVKWFGIIVFIAVIGFSFASCGDDGGGGGNATHTHQWSAWKSNAAQHWKECDCGEEYQRANHTGTPCSVCGYQTGSTVTYSLNGIWLADRGVSDHIVTISGSTGVFTQISSLAAWQDAINKGYVKAGDQKFRNITTTGARRWTAQGFNVVYNTPAPNVAVGTRWTDNFTITMNANGLSFSDGSITWTKTTLSLDGNWQAGRDVLDHVVTISGSTGVFVQISSLAAWQDAVNKGYVKVGDQKFRNLRNTGGLTWTGESFNVVYNTPAPNVAVGMRWSSFTTTMNANGLSWGDSPTWYRR
jgi:roadblock/LC7 domain-containing protein